MLSGLWRLMVQYNNSDASFAVVTRTMVIQLVHLIQTNLQDVSPRASGLV